MEQTNKGKGMNHKFDELAKGLAQSVTRRQALKRFGIGLAGMALACFGLVNRTEAHPVVSDCACVSDDDCKSPKLHCSYGICVPKGCSGNSCCGGECGAALPPCAPNYAWCDAICHLESGC
jgi:hypothetical protein